MLLHLLTRPRTWYLTFLKPVSNQSISAKDLVLYMIMMSWNCPLHHCAKSKEPHFYSQFHYNFVHERLFLKNYAHIWSLIEFRDWVGSRQLWRQNASCLETCVSCVRWELWCIILGFIIKISFKNNLDKVVMILMWQTTNDLNEY